MTVTGLFRQTRRWIKGSYCALIDFNGKPVQCFCLVGAIEHTIYGPEETRKTITESQRKRFHAACERVRKVLKVRYQWTGGVESWNDNNNRTIEEVRDVARRARI